MNLPNKLTVLRLLMVPAIIIVLLLPVNLWTDLAGAAIFLATAITDMLDGRIARKRGLVTDFGKFLDPLADKFMVISAMMCVMVRQHGEPLIFYIFSALVMITIFRELAVTSIRLVAVKNANIVVAANMLGKIKTVSQIVCVMAVLLEPWVAALLDGAALQYVGTEIFAYYPITIAASAVTLIFTVWSGVVYLKTYWKYLDTRI